MNINIFRVIAFIFATLCAVAIQAGTVLAYPEGDDLTADEIALQTFAATRGGLLDNAISVKSGKDIAMLVNRAPLESRLKDKRRKPSINTFETWINSRPDDPAIDSRQMAIFRSGKVRGTGVLFTSYTDTAHAPDITLWFPALRKLRRLNEPAHEDTWGGSNLTYGELVLRKPEHEVHELAGEAVLNDCLPVMVLKPEELTRRTRNLPGPQCGHKGKPVYLLKSTTKFPKWWYDYHISEIDKKTFALYRTVYYKDGKKVKTVVIDWQSLDQPDPRIAYPRFIYALSHERGQDSMVYIPRSTIQLNTDIPDSFWSAETLKKQGRRKK